MASEKMKKIGLAVISGVLFTCGSIMVFGGDSTRDAVEQARAACVAPNSFKLRPGGAEDVPTDWQCTPPPAAAPPPAQPDAKTTTPSVGSAAPSSETGFWAQPMTAWSDDGDCADPTLWSLFKELHAGKDEFDKREREKERRTLATAVKERIFVVHLDAERGEYDFARHRFPITITQSLDCKLSGADHLASQHVWLALSGATARHYADYGDWELRPWKVHAPMPEDRARTLRGSATVDLAFRVGDARYDVCARRNRRLDVMADCGAGALVHADIVAYRVRVGETTIQDTAPASP